MARKSSKKKAEPRVMLHGRVLYQDIHGEISDATHGKYFGLKDMAERGELAMYILSQCRKRLEVLAILAESRSQLDARHVRILVEDALGDLGEGNDLSCYVELSQEMFANSEALPPIPNPDMGNNGRSLTLVTPAL